MTIKHSYTATGTNDGTKQVSVTRWNEDHAVDMEGLVIPLHTSTPSTPAADNVKLFCKEIANRAMPAFMGPSGLDATLQPHIIRQRVNAVIPNNGGGTSVIGTGFTTTGTATSATVSTTSLHTQMVRIDYLVTTASTSAIAEFRSNVAGTFHRGTAAGRGGFHMICRVAPATGTTVATQRFFCGMCGTGGGTALSDVNPSTLANIAGVGYDAADTNWQIMFNDGSGAATKVDTGVARPTTDRPDPIEVSVFCAPNGGTIYVDMVLLATGAKYSANESTNIPSTNQMLSFRGYHSVGGTSSVVGISLFGLYCESDN